MVEDMDFVPMLHGDELVFNSGLNYVSEEWLKRYIEALNKECAGGLMIAIREASYELQAPTSEPVFFWVSPLDRSKRKPST